MPGLDGSGNSSPSFDPRWSASTPKAETAPIATPTAIPQQAAPGDPAVMANYAAVLRNQYAPQFAENAVNTHVGAITGQMRNAYYDQQANLANSSYANSLAALANQRQNTQYDIGAINQNRPLYDLIKAQYGVQGGLNDAQLAAQQGFANRGYDNTSNFTGQTLQNQLAQNALATLQAHQHAGSAAVAGGFGLAPGVQMGQDQITQSGDLKAADYNISAAQRLADALLGRDEKLSSSQFSHDNTASNLAISSIRADISRNLDETQLKKLQSQAASYGIDANTLYDQLQSKLNQTGMDKFTNVGDMFKLAASSSAQDQALYNQMLQSLYQYGQTSPNVSAADVEAYRTQQERQRDAQELDNRRNTRGW